MARAAAPPSGSSEIISGKRRGFLGSIAAAKRFKGPADVTVPSLEDELLLEASCASTLAGDADAVGDGVADATSAAPPGADHEADADASREAAPDAEADDDTHGAPDSAELSKVTEPRDPKLSLDEARQAVGVEDIYRRRFEAHFGMDIAEVRRRAALPESAWTKHEEVLSPTTKAFVSAPPGAAVPGHLPPLHHLQSLMAARMVDGWMQLNHDVIRKASARAKARRHLGTLQAQFFAWLSSYKNIYYPNQTLENRKTLVRTYCLHAMRHIWQSRQTLLENNAALEQAQAAAKESKGMVPDALVESCRDQGFTRPRVLILVPMKNAALPIFQNLVKLVRATQVENKNRVEEDFQGPSPEEDEVDWSTKPADHTAFFKGNTGDAFRVGIRIGKKTMHYYSPFYNSDILVCSPLGLRTIIGVEGDRKRESDFLSSIEMVIVDDMQTMMMQNMDHLQIILQSLNKQPREDHGCDISRLAPRFTEGVWPSLCQTVFIGAFSTPMMQHLFKQHAQSVAGTIRVQPTYDGVMNLATTAGSQAFRRIATTSLAESEEARFAFFTGKVMAHLSNSVDITDHVVLFIPSYLDFLRVRAWCKEQSVNFQSLHEYSKPGAIVRARRAFLRGECHFLLVTERYYFYHRLAVRNVHKIVFYALPETPQFYPEWLDAARPPPGVKPQIDPATGEPSLQAFKSAMGHNATILFTRYDRLRLERIVGTERAHQMLTAASDSVIFST